ncbi:MULTISPECIES: outer membrane beta-barrel protein [unclassified Stenotrophomonas]|uniref:outer membrane beta-barrel protein n=1 Tax=unclassified Stenotrophomonas TaxID=196198 RepID=UPI00249A07E1|nr:MULTISPECIES: outer membrane beta-barrel protein [unclassified Stenotrophomonas]
MKKFVTLAAAIALATLSTNAFAGQAFVRGELGSSETEVSFNGFSGSESDTAAVLGGGYWFTPNIGVEGHVGSLYNKSVGYDEELDLVSIGAGLVVKKNFGADNTGFFIGARAGVARMTAQVREDTWDVVDDESSTKPYYGVNVGYDFSRRWGLSLNYDRRQGEFSGVDVDVDTYSLGGEFRF